MPFKPMPLRVFLKYIDVVDWKLERGSSDHNLYDDNNCFVCSIKVTHGKNTKANDIAAISIKKVEREFKKRGLVWPPRKK
jgi:hypothetical protein